MTVLSMAAGLLFMLSFDFGCLSDRLTEWERRFVEHDVDFVFFLHL